MSGFHGSQRAFAVSVDRKLHRKENVTEEPDSIIQIFEICHNVTRNVIRIHY